MESADVFFAFYVHNAMLFFFRSISLKSAYKFKTHFSELDKQCKQCQQCQQCKPCLISSSSLFTAKPRRWNLWGCPPRQVLIRFRFPISRLWWWWRSMCAFTCEWRKMITFSICPSVCYVLSSHTALSSRWSLRCVPWLNISPTHKVTRYATRRPPKTELTLNHIHPIRGERWIRKVRRWGWEHAKM